MIIQQKEDEVIQLLFQACPSDQEPSMTVIQQEDKAAQQRFQSSPTYQQPVSWPDRFGIVEFEENDLMHCELASSCAGDMSAVCGDGRNPPLYDIYFGTADLEIWKEEELYTDHLSKEISGLAPKTMHLNTHEDEMVVFDEVLKTQPEIQLKEPKGGDGEQITSNDLSETTSKVSTASGPKPNPETKDLVESTAGYTVKGQAMKRRRRLWDDDDNDENASKKAVQSDQTGRKDSLQKSLGHEDEQTDNKKGARRLSEDYEDSLDEDDKKTTHRRTDSVSVSDDSLDELLDSQPRGLRYTDLLHSSPNLSQDSLGESTDSYEQVSGPGYVEKLFGNQLVPMADEEVLSNFTDDSIEVTHEELEKYCDVNESIASEELECVGEAKVSYVSESFKSMKEVHNQTVEGAGHKLEKESASIQESVVGESKPLVDTKELIGVSDKENKKDITDKDKEVTVQLLKDTEEIMRTTDNKNINDLETAKG